MEILGFRNSLRRCRQDKGSRISQVDKQGRFPGTPGTYVHRRNWVRYRYTVEGDRDGGVQRGNTEGRGSGRRRGVSLEPVTVPPLAALSGLEPGLGRP